jgi:uncharacterized phiE125 gp8 family phage protein
MSNPKVIIPPTSEPISIDEATAHLRIDVFDPLVRSLIPVARQWVEKFTGRSMTERLLEIAMDAFPGHHRHGYRFPDRRLGVVYEGEGRHPHPIRLLGGPVNSLDRVIYTDVGGIDQVITDAQFDSYEEPARVLPAVGTTWPSTQIRMGAVKVRYWAGYSAPDDSPIGTPLPLPLKHAMLLVLGHLYENREDSADVALESIPLGAEALARPYRLDTALA